MQLPRARRLEGFVLSPGWLGVSPVAFPDPGTRTTSAGKSAPDYRWSSKLWGMVGNGFGIAAFAKRKPDSGAAFSELCLV